METLDVVIKVILGACFYPDRLTIPEITNCPRKLHTSTTSPSSRTTVTSKPSPPPDTLWPHSTKNIVKCSVHRCC